MHMVRSVFQLRKVSYIVPSTPQLRLRLVHPLKTISCWAAGISVVGKIFGNLKKIAIAQSQSRAEITAIREYPLSDDFERLDSGSGDELRLNFREILNWVH